MGAAELISNGSEWSYFVGTNEASVPATAWRGTNFNDAAWLTGATPLGYGEPDIITFTPAHDGTNYLSVFLRKTFVVNNPTSVQQVTASIRVDDGCVVWINGKEFSSLRYNVPGGEIAYTTGASAALEPALNTFATNNNVLVAGTNVIAVQVVNFNNFPGTPSSDLLFDASLSIFIDDIAPTLSEVVPAPGATVAQLTQIEMLFSEDVAGVDVSDLLVNGNPCTNLTVLTPNHFFRFQFPQPPTGVVQVTWSGSHGIQDFANPPNSFVAVNSTYVLDTNLPTAVLIISEFLASNSGEGTNALRDADGDAEDWIEIRNLGSGVANLNGWSLTDRADLLTKWRFPDVSISADGYLVVFASEKHPTTLNGGLHTNFRLNTEGEFLALVDPMTNIVSVFTPLYPTQTVDISYGRDRVDTNIAGYFQVPTPGAPNTTSGAGIAPPVQFSRSGGAFASAFSLTLSNSSPSAVIRYAFGPGAVVTTNSTLYTGPINVSTSAVVRARTFQTGLLPGPTRSESYLQLSAAAANWSSDLPVVILHTFGNTAISAGAGAPDTPANVTIIEPNLATGRTRLTNSPSVTTRAGLNLRGSSTQGLAKRNLAVEYWDEANNDLEIETLGMPAESDWVLYPPNGFDHPLIHNPFIYEVSRQVGRYATRTRFVELFYKAEGQTAGAIDTNMNYYGVYVLTEKIKRDNNRVDVEQLQPEDTSFPAVTGGYLFLINSGRVDANEIALNVPTPQGNQEVIYQDPEGPELTNTARLPQRDYIRGYLTNFSASLGPNFTNPVTGYLPWIDVDSWIDHHILNVLGRNVDAIRLSGYFYKDREKRIEFGPIWDFDRSMGTGKPSETDIGYRSWNPREWLNQASGDRGTDFFRFATHRWWGRLFEDIDFWQRYIDRWQELRRTHFTTNNLFAIIDGMVAEITEAQRREAVRWPGGGSGGTAPRSGPITANGYTFTFDGTYADEIRFLKQWLTERMDFVDTNFLAAPLLSIPGGQVSSGITLTITPPSKPGSTVYYTLDGTDPRLPGGGISPAALVYSGPITITSNVRVFARARNPSHMNVINANCPFGGCPPVSTPWSGKAVETYYISIPPLRITEIMYHPQDPPPGNTNDDNNFEYVEVKNIGGTPLNLNRFRISGGIEFDFPNILLPAGSNIVVVANTNAFQSRYGTNTIPIAGVYTNRLDNAGERLVLEGPVREPILDFSYDDEWYPITDGFGFSLVIVNDNAPPNTWGLKESWRPSGVLNGSPGANDPAQPAFPLVVINEVLSHTDPPPPTDSIELRNLSGSPANIGGWFLTDDFSEPKKYRIANNTMIAAGDFIVFNESQFNSGANGFALNSLGEEVYLFSGDANTNLSGYFHGFDFGPAENGVTFGRYVISTGDDQFPSQTMITLGDINAGPRIGPVVVSEIMYHPPDLIIGAHMLNNTDDEYIELHNFSGTNVQLYHTSYPSNTWRLRNAVDFDFPQGVTLPPNGRLLVVEFDPADTNRLAEFRMRNGVSASVPIYGPFSGNLDNETDAVELRKPDLPEPAGPPNFGLVPYVLVERIRYSDVPPWPIAADGIGPSLQRIVASSYGNDPSNWVAAAKSPGTAYGGGVGPSITAQPTNKSVVAFMTATFNVGASGPNLSYQWRFNGGNILNATNATLVLTNVQPSQAGQYLVVVLNPSSSVASSNATLTVLIPPRITQQPTNLVLRGTNGAANYGQTFTNAIFSVVASSSSPITYRWRFNGADISGTTNASLIISNATLANEGLYDVVATDSVGPIISAPARLSVFISPLITLQPLGATVAAGSQVTFSVTARGHPLPFGYRWRRNGILYTFVATNSTNATLTLNNVSNLNAGAWTVVVTNQANTTGAISTNATLTVVTPPTNQVVPAGGTAIFTVFATNTPGSFPGYQWRFNNTDISGATTNNYSVTNVQPSHVGSYSVVVTATNLPAPPPASFSALLSLLVTGPMLSNPEVLSNGVFRAQLKGTTNQMYAIESSRDLTNWSVLTNLTFLGSPAYFVDPGRTNATGATNRFYRARETP